MSKRPSTPRGSPKSPPHADRLSRLRRALKRDRLDSILISNPNDIRYLTGFSGEASTALVTQRDFVLISDFRFQEELDELHKRVEVVIRKGAMLAAQAAVIKRLKPRTIAIQSEHLTVQGRRQLEEAAGSRRLRDTEGHFTTLRLIKDATEIAAIQRGATIQQEALRETIKSIRVGQTEREIAGRLEFEMRRRGADGLSFETIVAAKANGSKPHYRAGSVKTAKGQPLLIDWGARVDGYCADMTRTFSIGSWSRKMREVYELVLEAHLAAIDAAKPGMTCAELDGVARRIITDAGYGAQFGHGLGHGIGLDIHEGPRVMATNKTVLEPGMVITIEPGVYLPGVGGVRIEDDILLTDRGARNLCSLPKTLEWATLHG